MYKLIINAKAYNESAGKDFEKLVNVCRRLSKFAEENYNTQLILAPQTFHLIDSINNGISTYSQHIDSVSPGSHTGFTSPDNIKKIGCGGTILNHSEHILSKRTLRDSIQKAKDANLEVCLCARNPSAVKKYAQLNPDMIALEPKELIGGEVSISTAKPQIITKAKSLCPTHIPLLVGAGVKTREDVEKAVELGSQGILVASGVVKSKEIEKSIIELLEGFITRDK